MTRPGIDRYQPTTSCSESHLLIYNYHHCSYFSKREPMFYLTVRLSLWSLKKVVAGDNLHVIVVALLGIQTPIRFPV